MDLVMARYDICLRLVAIALSASLRPLLRRALLIRPYRGCAQCLQRLCHNLRYGAAVTKHRCLEFAALLIILVGAIVLAKGAAGQQSASSNLTPRFAIASQTGVNPTGQPETSSSQAPVVLTLQDALARARNLDPNYRASLGD